MEGGSATLPINLVSPPTTTSPTEDPELPNWGGDPEVATGSEPVSASHPRTQSPMVVHESPQYIVVDESPPPPPRPNTVGPVPPPPSPRHRQVAYIEQVQGIPHLIRPSSGGGSGGGHSSSGRAPVPVAARPTPLSRPAAGPSGPSVAGGAAGGGGGGSSPPTGGGGPSFQHSGGPAPTRGKDDLQHTCCCPRCVVQYETCIESLMAQVKDLRTQNVELQRSHQELSQAVASTVGISQSYGDRMTQILSTLAKLDVAVQGYQRDSKVIILRCPTATRLSALAQWSRLLRVTPPLHLGSMRGTTGTPRLRNPLRWSCPRHRRLHPPLILNRRRLRCPWARHPIRPVVDVSFLSPSGHPSIASTI